MGGIRLVCHGDGGDTCVVEPLFKPGAGSLVANLFGDTSTSVNGAYENGEGLGHIEAVVVFELSIDGTYSDVDTGRDLG